MIDDIGITNDRVNLLWIGASKPIRPRQIFKNQEDLGMINGKSLFAAGLLASGLVLTSSPLDVKETNGDRRELRQDRREFRRDAKDALKN